MLRSKCCQSCQWVDSEISAEKIVFRGLTLAVKRVQCRVYQKVNQMVKILSLIFFLKFSCERTMIGVRKHEFNFSHVSSLASTN
jgi:hypothetical protein